MDLICKEHDLAYLEAESQSGSEAMQKFEADKDLLIKIAALDENLLTTDEKSYVKLMTAAFAAKIFTVDFPALLDEGAMTAIKDLMLSLHGLLDGIDGLSYMDQFGAMMWGAVNKGYLHGGFGDLEFWDIPFTRFTLIATDTAGGSAVISYYEDPYREAHGIAAVVAGEIVEGSSRTITLYDGGVVTAQSGLQDPVVLAEPSSMAWPGLYLDDLQVFPDAIPGPSKGWIPAPGSGEVDLADMPIPPMIGSAPAVSYPLPSVPPPAASWPSSPESSPPSSASSDESSDGPYYAELVDPPFPPDGTGPKGPPSPPIKVCGDPLNNPLTLDALWSLYDCDEYPDFVCVTLSENSMAYAQSPSWRGAFLAFEDERISDYLETAEPLAARNVFDERLPEATLPQANVVGQSFDDMDAMAMQLGSGQDVLLHPDGHWTEFSI
ncbi:hypothetical protein [Achromobacter ruhlandii]|uniref:hypothetical protein n=1 Tax=Achromobacter ruhlandii TaxID=72557 RepID=UPI003B9F762A